MACAILLGIPGGAAAQDANDLTSAEMADRLERQQQAKDFPKYTHTRGSGGSGCRGLILEAVCPDADEASDVFRYVPQNASDAVWTRVAFDLDSAAIRPDQRPKLDALCAGMRQAEGVETFLVIGHTDALGEESYNERLSRLRAEEVKRYMIETCGFSENRIDTIGMGERAPLDGHGPRAPENRRVEIQAG
jgi:outer membrane protein OmpA-like peptidoglycan-associated protein